MHEDGVGTEQAYRVAVGHWGVGERFKEGAVGGYFGAVHGYGDSLGFGDGCHFFVEGIGNTVEPSELQVFTND